MEMSYIGLEQALREDPELLSPFMTCVTQVLASGVTPTLPRFVKRPEAEY